MAPDPLLCLADVSKIFRNGIVGLDHIDLEIGTGEFLSLLGPSGCGKTTSLRLMAGFEQPTGGRVILDGRDITATKPYERPVNTVFQDYALFPHMTVAENVGFGLSTKGVAAAEIKRRVGAVLDLVGLANKTSERVTALSGGQRQRVALARAVVCEPRVLLLDEPLSALDAHLREEMQAELKRLQTQLGTTFVMVTHDQNEALSISDRIVVMNKGRIEQAASPAELYDAPATTFVAGFIGTMNLLDGRIIGREIDKAVVEAGALRLHASGTQAREGAVVVGVRPEDIVLSVDEAPGAPAGRVRSVAFHGRALRVVVQLDQGPSLVVDLPRAGAPADLGPGLAVSIALRPESARVLTPSERPEAPQSRQSPLS
jgi:spermidine/putrescine transport system ATP-binding protein